MTTIALSTLIWTITALTLALNWRKSPLNLLVLTALMVAIVGTFFPLLSSIVEPLTWRNLSGIGNGLGSYVQLNYFAAALGLLFAALAINFLFSTVSGGQLSSSASTRVSDTYMATCLCVAGIALYGFFIVQVGIGSLLNQENYAEKYAAGGGLGGFGLGINVVILACLWAEGGSVSPATKHLFRAIAGLVLVWTIFGISVRSYAAILLIGYLYIFCVQRKLTLGHVRPGLILGLVGLWLLAEIFSLIRSNTEILLIAVSSIGQSDAFLTDLGAIVGGSEFAHPFITFSEVVRDRRPGELAGASYARELLGILPQRIWPERPETLAQEFVRTAYPAVALRGGGTGFSLTAESWLNFGAYFGPFIVTFFVGFVLAAIEKLRSLWPNSFIARLVPILALPVIMAERSSLVVATKQTLAVTLVALVIYSTYKLFAVSSAPNEQRLLRA